MFSQLDREIIDIYLLKKVPPYAEPFSQFNFLLPRLSLPWKHNQNARQPVPAIIISCEAIKARYDAILDQSEDAHLSNRLCQLY